MKDKDYFISMSHEFKSPVTNLTLFLETLYEYDKILSQDEKKEIFELGLKETDRLKELIGYFLYGGESKNLTLTKETFDSMKVCFRDLNNSYDLIFSYRNLLVKFYIHHLDYAFLSLINNVLYSHIILNLCENASKFTPNGKWILVENENIVSISLKSFECDVFVRSSVIDGGFGFKDKIRSHIKSNIVQNETNLSKMQKLGLTIVKSMLLSGGSQLNGLSYPMRGAKLFFIIRA